MSTDVVSDLIAAGADIVRQGLTLASAGNLSARVAGTDEFVVTATRTWLDRLTPNDFTRLDGNGQHRGGAPAPSGEWRLHARTYATRADVTAIVHVHPQYAVLVNALGHDIRMLTLDHAFYLRDVGAVPFWPSGSQELADAAAEAARSHDAVLLAHHGCSTVGDSVDMALRRALLLEQAAQATYRMLLLGDTTTTFPPEWKEDIVRA